jgi:hypothetical protein
MGPHLMAVWRVLEYTISRRTYQPLGLCADGGERTTRKGIQFSIRGYEPTRVESSLLTLDDSQTM